MSQSRGRVNKSAIDATHHELLLKHRGQEILQELGAWAEHREKLCMNELSMFHPDGNTKNSKSDD